MINMNHEFAKVRVLYETTKKILKNLHYKIKNAIFVPRIISESAPT